MTWFDDEKTTHDAEPVELYEFVTPTQTFRLTSYSQDYTFMSNLYTRSVIKRGKIDQASGADRTDLVIEVSANEALSQAFIGTIPEHELLLTLYRVHPFTGNSAIIWDGPVTAITSQNNVTKFRVPSLLVDAIRTNVPTVVTQRHCNHVLYDQFCGLDSTVYDQSVQVSTISADGLTITTDGGTPATDLYKGGEMTNADGERRLVLSSTSGNVHTINLPFINLSVTDFVTRFQGCDHTIETCQAKFSNEANFGGMAYVPSKNLFRIYGGIRGGGVDE